MPWSDRNPLLSPFDQINEYDTKRGVSCDQQRVGFVPVVIASDSFPFFSLSVSWFLRPVPVRRWRTNLFGRKGGVIGKVYR